MEIILNNRQESFDREKITISEILQIKNYTFKMLVIKVNSKLIKKDAYDIFEINEGDNVIVLHLVSGG
ncbi:MAG: sulfur carrier protein ThiS [Bacteroidales bacterium]|nr:sulfur carrier protein ThiS [Bacteroidales bacterium]